MNGTDPLGIKIHEAITCSMSWSKAAQVVDVQIKAFGSDTRLVTARLHYEADEVINPD